MCVCCEGDGNAGVWSGGGVVAVSACMIRDYYNNYYYYYEWYTWFMCFV